MAEITRLSRLLNGIQRQVDLSSNTLVVLDIKVGGSSGTILSKAILDNLINLQNGTDFADGTNAHTHDGRYYTETELSSNDNAKGASLIGIEDVGAYYLGTQVEAALTELSNQIGGSTSSTFTFTEANVLANNDAIYAALNKLDLRWGDLASIALNEGASLVGIHDANNRITATTVEGALDEIAEKVNNLATLSGVAANSTDLGTFTGSVIPDASTIKAALQSLETYAEQTRSLVVNFEWQPSVIDRLATPPATPNDGDRYLVIATATGAWAGKEDQIAQWNASTSSWDFIVPTTGTYVSVDDEADGLYLYGGSSWTKKFFEATTASTGLTKVGFDIRIADFAATNGLSATNGVFTVETDGSTLELAANKIQVKADGINETHIQLNNDGWLTALSASSVATNILRLNASDALELAFLPILSSAVNPTDPKHLATKQYVDDVAAAQDDASEITYTPATLTDWQGGVDPGNVDGALDQLASRTTVLEQGSDTVKRTMVAGEAFAANTVAAVRLSLAGETDGRVYKADKDASASDKFYVIGLVYPTAAVSAGDNIDVIMLGEITSSVAFTAAQDEGKPVFLDAAGAITLTAPSLDNEAVVRVGVVSKTGVAGTAKILVQGIQVVGVN